MSLQPIANFDFSCRSALRVGGKCEAYFPESNDELICLIDRFYKDRTPFKIVGRASNLLAKDGLLKTKVIFTDHLNAVSPIDNGVCLGAGTRFSRIIFRMAKEGKSLLPELIGVPGSVGGMVCQNASCYHREISDCFRSARVYDPEQKCVLRLSRDEMKFSYRDSILKKRDYILLDAEFSFLNNGSDPISIIREVTKKRRARAPEGPSLGSVFLRHENRSVGELLDHLGQKGRRFGGISVSCRHCGVLINKNNATCEDYLYAVNLLSQLVFSQYGFMPKTEIELLE